MSNMVMCGYGKFLQEATPSYYFLRRTAVLILRPAIPCCAGVAVELLFDPMLKVGVEPKPKPAAAAGAAGWGTAGGAGLDAPPNVNTFEAALLEPKAFAPPNWKPPLWPVVEFEAPNAGVVLADWPKTGAGVELAPNAGAWGPAEKDAGVVPNADGAGCDAP